MRVQETFLVMSEAPLRDDGSTARDDAGYAVDGQRDVSQQYTGVYGEIVHALFGLLDQCVTISLPCEVFGNASHFLQRLVNRHGTDRHRRITNYPLPGFVNVFAGG